MRLWLWLLSLTVVPLGGFDPWLVPGTNGLMNDFMRIICWAFTPRQSLAWVFFHELARELLDHGRREAAMLSVCWHPVLFGRCRLCGQKGGDAPGTLLAGDLTNARKTRARRGYPFSVPKFFRESIMTGLPCLARKKNQRLHNSKQTTSTTLSVAESSLNFLPR